MQRTSTIPKLSKTASHRRAMFRNMAVSLIDKERIVTTRAKAKAVRPIVERFVTIGKRARQREGADRLHLHRILLSRIQRKEAVQKLIYSLADRYAQRAGGYLRILHIKPRESDHAPLSIIEFVDKDQNDGLQKYLGLSSVPVVTTSSQAESETTASPTEPDTEKSEQKPSTKQGFFKSAKLPRIGSVRKDKSKKKGDKKDVSSGDSEKKRKAKKGEKKTSKLNQKQKKHRKEETPEELKRKERARLLMTPTKKKKTAKKKTTQRDKALGAKSSNESQRERK